MNSVLDAANKHPQDEIMDFLQENWASYVDRFHKLQLPAQSAFLKRQGYARLADLLAHILAWWEAGISDITHTLKDPNYQWPDYEVDSFNARAIERFRNKKQAEVIEAFESMRQAELEFVNSLTEDAFKNPEIPRRLQMDVIGHYREHELTL